MTRLLPRDGSVFVRNPEIVMSSPSIIYFANDFCRSSYFDLADNKAVSTSEHWTFFLKVQVNTEFLASCKRATISDLDIFSEVSN
jgi:hypothetical protein